MLVDSNLVIYAGKGKLDGSIFSGEFTCSIITKIEALGYHKLSLAELNGLEQLLDTAVIIPINDKVVATSIKLRQAKSMGLGDCLIAATALVYDLELWTANTQDFQHISGLTLHNPIT